MGAATNERTKQAGILLINKPAGRSSFSLIPKLRYLCNEKKIGHGGTLDPLATGVMVYLVGKKYTKMAESFLGQDKKYTATVRLGEERDSYDIDGNVIATSDTIPSIQDVEKALKRLSGEVLQTPPMFSAKKVNGKKLYELARVGKTIERKQKRVNIAITIINYTYPQLEIHVACSSGTYIRSIAHDLGELLNCYGCIEKLHRVKSGAFTIDQCKTLEEIENAEDLSSLLIDQL